MAVSEVPALKKLIYESWIDGELVIPIRKEDRVALRLQLETASRMGEMFLPGNQETRQKILGRIEELEEFEKMIA